MKLYGHLRDQHSAMAQKVRFSSISQNDNAGAPPSHGWKLEAIDGIDPAHYLPLNLLKGKVIGHCCHGPASSSRVAQVSSIDHLAFGSVSVSAIIAVKSSFPGHEK